MCMGLIQCKQAPPPPRLPHSMTSALVNSHDNIPAFLILGYASSYRLSDGTVTRTATLPFLVQNENTRITDQ